MFADVKGINHPWYKDKMCADKDWFSRFMKNRDAALRKPEGLSRAIAQGLNHRAVDYFDLYGIPLSMTEHTLFSVWMTQGVHLIMSLRKLSAGKDIGMLLS